MTTQERNNHAAQIAARTNHASNKLTKAFSKKYEEKPVVHSAVTAGRNQVQIGGHLYPAEGVTGEGGAISVINVGTPAVAKYAPPNRSVVAVAGSGRGNSGGGGGGGPHYLNDPSIHLGQLDWAQLSKISSSLADLSNRAHSNLTGVGPNDHHNQSHALVGSDHTASGLTIGHTVRATGATTFAWAQLQHGDLGGVTPNQHHNQQHNIVGSDHTVTGSQWDVVGLTATNALGLLQSSDNPGAAARLLRTNANGGLQLDTNVLFVDAVNNRNGINRTPGNAALDVLSATNADHTLRVKQKSGQIGRLWRVEDTAGDELIVLDSQGNLQSGKPGFYSGLTGWQIAPQGNAEFNNIWARGELHATVFVKDEVHATGGTMLVASAGKLYADAAIDNVTVDTEVMQFETVGGLVDWQVETALGTFLLEIEAVMNYIDIEDPPSGPGFYFQARDVVRSKTEVDTGVTDFWLEVRHGVQYSGYSRYSVTKRSGTDGVLPAGSAVVEYGQPGDGRILLTSDLNYAPYMDIFTVGPNVWSGDAGSIIPRVRLGRLDGVGVTGTSGIEQYGIIMGTDLSNANSPYIVASNLQLRLHKVNLTGNDGTNDTFSLSANGNLILGSNIGVEPGRAFQFVTADEGSLGAGDLLVGSLSDQFMQWDQSAGKLIINGDLKVSGSDVASQSYASSVASTAQSNANTYTDTNARRRVAAVMGSWTSTTANTITWTSASVRLGDNSTKSITNGTSSSFSGRRYFYVDVSASAPLTVQMTSDPSSLTGNDSVLVVADSGTTRASLSVIGGSTYISGNNIFTGTIVASNIASGTITANEIRANAITAEKILAGAVTADKITVDGDIGIGTTGSIRGNNKAYGSSTPGFFLGYNGGNYRFDVGNDNYYLRWTGSSLSFSTDSAITVNVPATTVLYVGKSGQYRSLTYNVVSGIPRMGSDAEEFGVNTLLATKLINTGSTMQIATERTVAPYTSAGLKGEICWDINYLYICISTNNWRRIAIPNTSW